MSPNANTTDKQQMSTHNSHANSTTEIPSTEVTLSTVAPSKDDPIVLDATVFAGTNTMGPVQTRDGTPHLSFVPIGGTFVTDNKDDPPPTQPKEHPTTNKEGGDNAPTPLSLSPIPPHSEKSTSPTPLPIPPRPQNPRHPGTDSDHDSTLTSHDPDRDRYSPKTLLRLWRRVKALKQYYTEHHRHYPSGFSLPGLSKTAVMIKELDEASEPPENLANFMSKQDIRYKRDLKLAEGLQAAWSQIAEYMDDNRDVPKEQTHDT